MLKIISLWSKSWFTLIWVLNVSNSNVKVCACSLFALAQAEENSKGIEELIEKTPCVLAKQVNLNLTWCFLISLYYHVVNMCSKFVPKEFCHLPMFDLFKFLDIYAPLVQILLSAIYFCIYFNYCSC